MNKVRCSQCGLANWDTAAACLRCKSSLDGAAPARPGAGTSRAKPNGGSSFGKVGALVAVLAIIGFGAYMFMMPASPPPAAAQTASPNAPATPQQSGATVVMDPQKVQQLMQEDLKKHDQKMDQIKSAVDTWRKGPDKETMKRYMAEAAKRAAPTPNHLPNPYQKP